MGNFFCKQTYGIRYKTTVYNTIDDYVHNNNNVITEIFIPKYNIIFNHDGHTLNIFDSKESRNTDKNNVDYILIPNNFIHQLRKHILLKKNKINKINLYLNDS